LVSEDVSDAFSEANPESLRAGRQVVSPQVGGRDAEPALSPEM